MKDKGLSRELDQIEMHPDAMERLERAVKGAARHAPIHQTAPKPAAKPRRSVVKKAGKK